MPRSSHGEISMRHFPDLSDDISFQIPAAQDDDLLAKDAAEVFGLDLDFDPFDDGELGGLDGDPFFTPIPKAKKHAPLTLSEITPRGAEAEARSSNHTENSRSQERLERDSQRQKQPVVRRALPQKRSIDDMFERRKRDNYQQMGIDLTSKSTARLRGDMAVGAIREVREEPRISTKGPDNVNPAPFQHSAESQTIRGLKDKAKRPILSKDAGIAKRRPRVPASSAQLQTTKPKSILKPPKSTATLPPSTLSRALTTLSHTPKAERPKWGDVVAEVRQTSRRRESNGSGVGIMGGGLIDVLVMYGEKLKGSLGFSSSGKSKPLGSSSEGSYTLPTGTTHRNSREDDGQTMHNMAGPSSKPLTISDLSPSREGGQHNHDVLTLSDLSPSKRAVGSSRFESGPCTDEPYWREMSPMRPSRKRTSSGTPGHERERDRVDSEPESIRSETGTSSKPADMRRSRPVKPVSKPKPLAPSDLANGACKKMPNARPRTQSNRGAAAASSRNLKGKPNHPTAGTHSRRTADKEQRAPTDLTIPSAPLFASDIHRRRALEKTQRERDLKEQRDKEKKVFRAGAMPYFTKPAPPARPAVRPTVPAAFTFLSDARATQRNAEFEEKRKTWESRVTHQARPMPDFVAIHAVQTEATRRRRVVPVLPTDAPTLTTMARAREREQFEEEKKERDRATERLREQRDRERAEQEEKAYREARKRTVPRAHVVPEWYKDVPKRKEVD